jgi:hypothetical protein
MPFWNGLCLGGRGCQLMPSIRLADGGRLLPLGIGTLLVAKSAN